MSRNSKNLFVFGVCLAVAVTGVVVITRASVETNSATSQNSVGRIENRSRNLVLQPEALRVSRRLGTRFNASAEMISAMSQMSANLTIAGSDQLVVLTRRQIATGENVEFSLAGRLLTWNAEKGAESVSSTPTELERLVLERLIYDSPDYFVLAQLRGKDFQGVRC